MRDTRKLQFAAELVEEVSNDTQLDGYADRLSEMAADLDELRGRYHQELAAVEYRKTQPVSD